MESNTEKHLSQFNRNSLLSLFFYLIAVSAIIYFTVNEEDQIIESTVKITCFAIYLGFMMWSLINLKNYFEATRKDDYSMDILIYAMVGIPVYIFAFFYMRGKLKKDLMNL